MGLGKTVELISLITLNKRGNNTNLQSSHQNEATGITPSAATLIITPASILEQWKSEIRQHAPHLRVCHYKGLKASKLEEATLKKILISHDVVLTTYHILASEIHYANSKPPKVLRHEKKYKARSTPLIQIEWWRVCLDEAQMVESGVSNAATVARLIPRVNAWAVTGTPLRKDVTDLLGLLIFLRYEPFCQKAVWQHTMRHQKDIFTQIFSNIALRHTKWGVRDELVLPPQKRIVVTIPFSGIEEQHYRQKFEQMCNELELNVDGSPRFASWNPDNPHIIEKMREWLTRLRQTCLHPEVGHRNRRALGRKKDGPLRTVEEVLEVMIDQKETMVRSAERMMLLYKIKRGHLYSFGKEPQNALDVYLETQEIATNAVLECRRQLAEEIKTRNQARGNEEDGNESDQEDNDDRRDRLQLCRQRLRNSLEIQHMAQFFTATAYYQVKSDISLTMAQSERFHELENKESSSYDQAKATRQELLTDVSRNARKFISKVAQANRGNLVSLSTVAISNNFPGIESRNIMQRIDEFISLLNAQAEQLTAWRQDLVKLLLVKLIDHDDVDMTGDEYEVSTKQQDEQYCLAFILKVMIADRHKLITGQTNELVEIEVKDALRLVNDGKEIIDLLEKKKPGVTAIRDHGPAPELMLQNFQRRSMLVADKEAHLSLRAIITDIRHMITTIRSQQSYISSRAAAEVAILERELEDLQKESTIQIKVLTELEKELDVFRLTMNARLEFYRQLQIVSDGVQPMQEEERDSVDIERVLAAKIDEQKHAINLIELQSTQRFLLHLRSEASGQHEEKICTICRSEIEIGVLTACGHYFCKDCIQAWWSTTRTCPVCKRRLKERDFYDITTRSRDIQAAEEVPALLDATNHGATSNNSAIYSEVSASTMTEIQDIDLPDSIGTKIDTIVRTLLWIREHDPGAKTIIFSQFSEFLSLLGTGLQNFRIGYAAMSSKNGTTKFREDPSTECFLLHAKADSSGLNLINATHVFLCEPLINAALELQAIARVHRIGQLRPTTVWMFLISDTVEEAIYEISVKRRLTHMQRAEAETNKMSDARKATNSDRLEEKTLEVANSLELQGLPIQKLLTSGQSGGEIVQKDDLWSCLFGKPMKARTNVMGDAGRMEAVELEDDEDEVSMNTNTELVDGAMARDIRARAAERRQVLRNARAAFVARTVGES